MNRKLQKIILGIIEENEGIADWKLILTKTLRKAFAETDGGVQVNTVVKHQMDLLVEEQKLLRHDELPSIFYILTPKGHAVFDPWYKKVWNFILYDKNNLYVLVSIVISLISLVIAIETHNKA